MSVALWVQDLPCLIPECFSDAEDGDSADEEAFAFPAGKTELVCKPHLSSLPEHAYLLRAKKELNHTSAAATTSPPSWVCSLTACNF